MMDPRRACRMRKLSLDEEEEEERSTWGGLSRKSWRFRIYQSHSLSICLKSTPWLITRRLRVKKSMLVKEYQSWYVRLLRPKSIRRCSDHPTDLPSLHSQAASATRGPYNTYCKTNS
ncbi:hypothetical protein B296_00022175 [Ensete ventricosum]|uniref:Uncharacterized protein n=1 Tax=Ensete ventricosum TaxID=4639 RepID=A0A426YE73_ENSVE|nr:hypothetical protein B296_00022175 [Ensete ventricosum]